MFPHLFAPGRIGAMALKNRTIMAPMVRNYADPSGCATDRYEAHIDRVAQGGVGAIILEASFVASAGRGFTHQLGLHDDKVIDPLRRLVAAAHRHGAKLGVQLFHAGRQTKAAVSGSQPQAPSAVPCPVTQETPRALSTEEIAEIVTAFGEAAARAIRAGCDFVEIHGAHGYLIGQFLSSNSNRRTDAYGGSLDHRMRFLREVFGAVRQAVGAETPVIVRLSAEEFVADGLTIAETTVIARELESCGADALHISAGAYGSYAKGLMISPMSLPDAPLAEYAEQVRAVVSIPVITVDKIRTPELAEELLAYGVADFIALGRPLLADPDWPRKAQAGDLAGINKCIACQEGCISRLFAQQDVWCLVNPEAGREREFAAPSPGPRKRVMVVGGGPAGMIAALTARRGGHEVSLSEAAQSLGGQLLLASRPPHRPGWAELRRNLAYRVRNAGIAVRLGSTVTPEIIAQFKPDVLILATGSDPRTPPWPAEQGANVIHERDLLAGLASPRGHVLIAGGGCTGAETAEYVAEAGFAVTIIEAGPEIAAAAPVDERALLLARLARHDVLQLTNTRLMSVGKGDVRVSGPLGERVIACDTVVSCHGSNPDHTLGTVGGLAPVVLSVGDCVSARRVLDAMTEGALAGRQLGGPAAEQRLAS